MTQSVKILILVLAAALLVVAIFAALIYGFGIDNDFTRAFNRTVPVLPAALVGNNFISLFEIDQRVEMFERALSYQSKNVPIERRKVKREILDKLIKDEIVNERLKQYKNRAPVSFEDYANSITTNFKADPAQVFGTSDKDFIKNIILPDWRAKTLYVSMLSTTDSAEYRRAVEVKKILDGGADFTTTSENFSEDEAAKYLAGDIGFVSKDSGDPWLWQAAEKINSTSTAEIVVSPAGFHVMRILDRDINEPERRHIQHILIRGFDFNDYIERQKQAVKVYIFGGF